MYVVFDSTEVWKDLLFSKTSMRVLFEYKESIGIKVALPQVVVLEAINHVREEIEAAVVANNNRISKLSKTAAISIGKMLYQRDIDKLVDEFRGKIEKVIEKKFDALIPIPEVPHENLVMRDLNRKKPFERSGKGYRDALIWESILQLGRETQDKIVFISENTKDFSEDGSGLHKDLRDDQFEAGLYRSGVDLITSVREFVSEHIIPKLPEEKRIIESFNQVSKQPFEDALIDWMYDQFYGIDIDGDEIDLEYYYEEITLTGVTQVNTMDCIESREISDTKGYLKLACEFEIDVDTTIHSSNYDSYISDNSLSWNDLDYESSYTSESIQCTVEWIIIVQVDREKGIIDSVEIESLTTA